MEAKKCSSEADTLIKLQILGSCAMWNGLFWGIFRWLDKVVLS